MNIIYTLLLICFVFSLSVSEISPCKYFAELKAGTDIKEIEKNLSLPAPHNTLMGNSFYKDRIFEYVISNEKGIIRVGLTNSLKDNLKFNGDYEVQWNKDSCSKWTERPTPCDTIELLNREFVEHDYDGGSLLFGIFCKDELEIIHVEIGVSRGFYKQDYYFKNDKLVKVTEIQEVFPYVDSLSTLDYNQLKREYEVTYEIKANGIKKLKEKGEQTFGVTMTIEQKREEFTKNITNYTKKIKEKKARAKKIGK